jgi:DNA-binding Lrp family transcriptional regulator
MLTNRQLLILSELRRNSRQHLSQVAKNLNMPLSTLHDNYKIVKQYIKQNITLVDFEQLGYGFRMNFIFRIKTSSMIKNLLLKNMNVNSIYRINNKHTLLVECVFRNLAGAYEFKEMLQDRGLKKISMNYVIADIKKECFCM